MRILWAIAALLLSFSPAHVQAAEDRIEVSEDGTVSVEREVSIERSVLLGVLTDPSLVAVLAPSVRSKKVLQDGACPIYRVATRGLLRPLVYDFRSCTTESGITEDLVASEDFDAFRSLWELSPIEGGTKIRYALLVKPRLRVPSRLVRLGQRRSMRATLDRLVEQASVR